MCWNLAILPDSEREKAIAKLQSTLEMDEPERGETNAAPAAVARNTKSAAAAELHLRIARQLN